MFVYGGRSRNGMPCEDLHEHSFETGRWRAIECSAFPWFRRDTHSISIVLYNHKLLVFGGWSGYKKLNNVFQVLMHCREESRKVCKTKSNEYPASFVG